MVFAEIVGVYGRIKGMNIGTSLGFVAMCAVSVALIFNGQTNVSWLPILAGFFGVCFFEDW